MSLPERKRNRLSNYDYSSNGAYFITICTLDMQCVLSTIVGADDLGVGADDLDVGADDLGSPKVRLTKYGYIVEKNLVHMNEIYDEIKIDKYVIMPNHVHILLTVEHNGFSGAPRSSPPTNTLSKFVAALKKFTNKEIGNNIWQRSFHDHIIRNDEDYFLHLQYIEENPKKWIIGKDKYYT